MYFYSAVKAAFNAGRKALFTKPTHQLQFEFNPVKSNQPIYPGRSAANAFRRIWDERLINIQEQVYVIFLDHQNYPIGWRCLFTGAGNHCQIDTNLTFGLAMQHLARGIIIAHNHPSGLRTPSKQDITITKNIIKQSAILNIGFVDHIILTDTDYFSFIESNLLADVISAR